MTHSRGLTLDLETRGEIIGAVEAEMKRKEVEKKYGVVKLTISELVKLKRDTGSVKPRS